MASREARTQPRQQEQDALRRDDLPTGTSAPEHGVPRICPEFRWQYLGVFHRQDAQGGTWNEDAKEASWRNQQEVLRWLEECANGRGEGSVPSRLQKSLHSSQGALRTEGSRDLNHLGVGCACTYTYIDYVSWSQWQKNNSLPHHPHRRQCRM